MKHKSIRYRIRRNTKRKQSKHKQSKHKQSKHKQSKHKQSKHKQSKHKQSKHKQSKRTQKYRLRGGEGENPQPPLPPPDFKEVSPPLPGDSTGVQGKIAEQNNAQNQANKTLTGGSKRRVSKRRVSKRQMKHSGGGATICGGTPLNGADGYGYVSPNNCLIVPSVNNPTAQLLAIDGMNSMNIGAANAAGDGLVGKK
jgi:hypothetical protein